ncbi:hypothetical protein K443DRAFT_12775 [Laccaria amethystina LaAM-08-1]|uniref:Uncharacterized protein n=1 Tax=Laccaria amethystina LaAM-08-1 TaxID=1095629 RepID=A0A0C9WIV0_9AGAR|nr:hypothetical protein K443DRAFT_12775 [Laccaria amethystina LaAM-08-1]
MIPSNQRRTHRKRVSALRLSSDTTSTLPEYISPTGWHRPEYTENIPSDTPPDYPDSAEEADEDTDTDTNNTLSYVPHTASSSPRAQTASPRRPKRFQQTHKRRHSSQAQSNDSYLDSLLERSVHALEMSNTLLESSISTSTSLSAVLADDSRADSTLEARALNLSSRIRGNWDVQASWSGDLNEITRRVEVLFGDEDDARYGGAHSREGTGGVSCSLPSSSTRPRPHLHRPRRRPSLDFHPKSESAVPRLHYSEQDRLHLIAPPPRALTQYVGSTQDPESILLPSTLGLRCPSSFHLNAEHRTFSETASSSTTSLHSSPSLPKLNDKPLEPSTPAYNMLSSFVARAPSSSSTPSLNFTSFISKRRGSSTSSSSTEPRKSRSPDRARQDACRKGGIGHRPMTPPTEESSSSDGCVAKQTVISLRKILDDQPQPTTSSKFPPAPAFLPRTPAPVADAATSTATASISRLFTKGTHSSSTRPPSPPRHSSMKRTGGTSPSPSPTVLSIPDMLSVFGGSTPSSGRSTPKRISFAALPESYTSTRPEGSSTKFDKQKQRRRKRGGGTAGDGVKGKEGEEGGWWWNGWLSEGGTPHGLTMSLARQEERVQDRVTRNWSGRGYGGGLDEWAV